MNSRWSGKNAFLQMEDTPPEVARALAGGVSVHPASGAQPISIPGGLIHDWVGAVFLPHASLERVLHFLQDFNAHKNFYPQVSDSRTIRHSGNEVSGYWRLQQKGLVPVSFNVEQDASYTQISTGKWIGRAYAKHIAEINPGLFAHGREYPLGEGHGYLWRLYAYWSLEARDGGVLAECRTLSLSRDIPEGLAWAVAPLVQKMPQDSLASTMEATRRAIEELH